MLLGVTLAQGGLGYLQYLTGLPRPLVSLHMLGACLLVVALTWLVCATRERVGSEGTTRSRRADSRTSTHQLVGS